MTQEEINKAFEGRWRMKADFGQINQNRAIMNYDDFYNYIKSLCRDFFEVGVILGGKEIVSNPPNTIAQPQKTLFDKWWDMYDKKIDRGKCEKKFNKLSAKEQLACIEATPAYVASTPDIQYRRHPMTYLNNKSWENQIIPRNNATDTKLTIEQQRISKLADILAG
ncbi:MAG: hypothetical protein K6D91_05935 [Prevotella sp.]|nr:hypothetical protein [Prevotella sp.]